jgi:RNA polymerase sigma factor (sigma-70 family)
MAEVVEVDVEVLVGRAQAGDPDKAEDVTSETFEAVLRRLGGYRPGTDFEAWLFTIAHRRVSDHFRRQGRRRDVVTLREAPAADAAGPEEAALAAEDRTEVARAFSTLREDEQEVLAPRVLAGLSAAQAVPPPWWPPRSWSPCPPSRPPGRCRATRSGPCAGPAKRSASAWPAAAWPVRACRSRRPTACSRPPALATPAARGWLWRRGLAPATA